MEFVYYTGLVITAEVSPSLYISLRGPAQDLHHVGGAEFDGMGGDGLDGVSKVSFKFLYTL